MSKVIDNIIDDLFNKYNLTKPEINRIVKSQFKLLNKTIKSKQDTKVKLMYIGTFKPTTYRLNKLKVINNE